MDFQEKRVLGVSQERGQAKEEGDKSLHRICKNNLFFGVYPAYPRGGCPRVSATPEQIHTMDVYRAAALNTQIARIHEKTDRFDSALRAIDPQDIPGQDPVIAKNTAQRQFHVDLRDEAQFEYAIRKRRRIISVMAPAFPGTWPSG